MIKYRKSIKKRRINITIKIETKKKRMNAHIIVWTICFILIIYFYLVVEKHNPTYFFLLKSNRYNSYQLVNSAGYILISYGFHYVPTVLQQTSSRQTNRKQLSYAWLVNMLFYLGNDWFSDIIHNRLKV